MHAILAILTLAALWWGAPAFILWLPSLVTSGILAHLIPGPPQPTTWAQYEKDCLAGVHGAMAKANAERGDYRHRVERERVEQIVEG